MTDKQQVRMLATQHGVDDGALHPVAYLEGGEYAIGPELLASFIDLGVVELVEAKALDHAPANKAHKAAPRTK